jgi:hypothetical protein
MKIVGIRENEISFARLGHGLQISQKQTTTNLTRK